MPLERTRSYLCHNHIIIVMNDLMSFMRKTSGFLQESSSAVSHHVLCLIDGEKKLHEILLIYSWMCFSVSNRLISIQISLIIVSRGILGLRMNGSEWDTVGSINQSTAEEEPLVH